MLDRIQRWLSVDNMLPAAERLGPVGRQSNCMVSI